MRNAFLYGILGALGLPAFAQQPAPERIIEINGPVEEAISSQLARYDEGGRPEVLRLSDVLIYPFGLYQPVLSCTVLRACLVELESGEALISLITGDDQRWLIDHTATGSGGKTPLISVKPIDYNITTNLIISTDRRIYHITLDSPPRTTRGRQYNPLGHYTRHIRFYYPRKQARLPLLDQETTPVPGLTLESIHHRYSWKRDKGFPWEPSVVFDDGERVFIRLPDEAFALEQPLLSIGAKGQERVGEYLVRDGYYIVATLFEHARLIISGPPQRGWFGRSRQKQYALHIIRQ